MRKQLDGYEKGSENNSEDEKAINGYEKGTDNNSRMKKQLNGYEGAVNLSENG